MTYDYRHAADADRIVVPAEKFAEVVGFPVDRLTPLVHVSAKAPHHAYLEMSSGLHQLRADGHRVVVPEMKYRKLTQLKPGLKAPPSKSRVPALKFKLTNTPALSDEECIGCGKFIAENKRAWWIDSLNENGAEGSEGPFCSRQCAQDMVRLHREHPDG